MNTHTVSLFVVTILAAVLYVLLIFGGLITQPANFFYGFQIRVDIILAGLVAMVAYAGVRKLPFAHSKIAIAGLVISQVAITGLFLNYLNQRLIFSDDHPSFLYRFQLLQDHFPRIPFYNTAWNAGYSAREFLPSGILNAYLLATPLFKTIIDVNDPAKLYTYNYLIPYLYIFIVPWSVFFASRLLGLSVVLSSLAAVFSLGPSISHFEWLLRYGTLGFSLAAGLTPLCLALGMRLTITEKSPSWGHVFLLLLVSFCCISWTLSALAFIPLIIIFFWRVIKKDELLLRDERWQKILLFSLLFIAINGPWISVFVRESQVLNFVSGSTLPGSSTTSVTSIVVKKSIGGQKKEANNWSKLRREYRAFKIKFFKINPLLFVFLIPGILAFPNGARRNCLVLTLVWLLFVATVLNYYKPQLELHRMLVIASFLICVISALGVAHSFAVLKALMEKTQGWQRLPAIFVLLAIAGGVLLSPIVAAAAYLNRPVPFYSTEPKEFKELAKVINENGGAGRTFFLGFILHELGAKTYASQDGGHIAPLAYLAKKELYASDFYHTKWSIVDPIPHGIRAKGSAAIEEFLDLLNVTSVVTFNREWRGFCRKNSKYKELYSSGRFRVFSRAVKNPSYFLSGEGKLFPRKEGVSLIPTTNEVVLKYRFNSKLKTNFGEIEIFPVPVFTEDLGGRKTQEVSFIGLKIPQVVIEQGRKIEMGFFVKQEAP